MYPIVLFRPDLCQMCKKQAIEIYDYYNHPLKYRNIIDNWMSGKHSNIDNMKYAIYDMKCRSCGQHYNIIWENGYPLPDLRSGGGLYQQFINLYINGR